MAFIPAENIHFFFFSTFLPLWETLHEELTALSNIHANYSKKILEDIEQPFRQHIVSNSDFDEIQSMEESISKISREYDELDSKTQKVICWKVKRKREKIHFFHYSIKKQAGKVNQKQRNS